MKAKQAERARAGIPKQAAIFEYWSPYLIELNKYIEHTGGFNCFACGRPGPLQRSHILPLNMGGTNALSNLHLLCPNCHSDSEFLTDEKYWCWFKSIPRGLGLNMYIQMNVLQKRKCSKYER